jgi:hypothetical protein
MMRNGEIIVMRNGEEKMMEEEVALADGTKVRPDGQVLMPDGTTRMMREGETLTMDRTPAGAEKLSDSQFKEAMEDEELRDQLRGE